MIRTRPLLVNVVIAVHVVMLLIWVVLDRVSIQLWATHPAFRMRFADSVGVSLGTDVIVMAFAASLIGLLGEHEWGWWIAAATNLLLLATGPVVLGGLFIARGTAHSLFAWMGVVELVLLSREPVRRFYVGSVSRRIPALAPLKSWLSGDSPDKALSRVIASLTILLSLLLLLLQFPYLLTPGGTLYCTAGVVIGGFLYRRSNAARIAAALWHSILLAFVALAFAGKWFLLRYDYLSEVGTVSLLCVLYLAARAISRLPRFQVTRPSAR